MLEPQPTTHARYSIYRLHRMCDLVRAPFGLPVYTTTMQTNSLSASTVPVLTGISGYQSRFYSYVISHAK
jgi:hypothetical protein